MPVWKNSMELAEKVFNLTENLPKKEDYGFTSQIRRSALSISANIAESFGRHHTADKVNFLYISRGSLTETQSHLEYGRRVKYIIEQDAIGIDELLDEIHKEINKLILALKNN
ncbi:MAG: four helix bundle protein [Bacteroidota bacterium]